MAAVVATSTKLGSSPCSFLAVGHDGPVTATARLDFRLLGRFAVLRDGTEIPAAAFGGRKVRTLLRILATRRGAFVSHDTLAEALWPDRAPADPVANLQVLVNRARKALGDPGIIETGPGGYSLAGGPSCVVDAERFIATVSDEVARLPELHAALTLWEGEPLAEDAYADWAGDYRTRLLRLRQHALELAAGLALEAGDTSGAVDLAGTAVESEPLREASVTALIRALAASGDVAAALMQYEDYRHRLADELGVDPSVEAAALHRQLLLGETGPVPQQRPRRAAAFGELDFVGRDRELRTIEAALDASTDDGRGTTLLLSGGSGAGKSRLLDAVSRRRPVLRVRAYLPERTEPWTLVRTLLREVLSQDITFLDEMPAQMTAAVAWLLPEIEAASNVDPDPESRRVLLQEATLRLLDALGRPVAIDDLQWCDPTSLTVLETTAARLPELRLLLAFRPEELAGQGHVAAALDRFTTFARVDLAGLDDDALGALIHGDDLIGALGDHTDRSPMAVTEVLRTLAAEGVIGRGTDGLWRGFDPSAVSRAVEVARAGQRASILVRARSQGPRERELLALASLLAREVSVTTLAVATSSTEREVLDGLAPLFKAGLVRLGDLGWTTTHDMVNEAVVAELDLAERARLHARLAAALQAESGDAALIARHLRDAGDTQRAAAAFTVAAQQALDSFADQEAVHLAGAGIDLASAPAEVAGLREIRGQAHVRLGDISGGREDLRAALAAHRSGPGRSRLLSRLAMLSSGAEDLVRAAELAELALVEAGGDAPTRARALEVASVLDMNLERRERASQRAVEALDLYREIGDASGAARILDARAMATFLDGDITAGEKALRQAADLFEDGGDLMRVVTPRSTSGHALVFAGRASDGLERIDSAWELARTLGHPEGQAYALWHRAEALASLGRLDEASATADEALSIATAIGHRGWTATAWRAVGLSAQATGDLDTALHAFRSSLEVSEHLGLFASWAAARLAMVLVEHGELDEALALSERALLEGPPLGHYEARLAHAEVTRALGLPSAGAIARDALTRARSGGMVQGADRLVELST
jgi:DNA-binding SARP family transcriptional activator/tetratricopeptide (TPR) repeat protein